MPAYDESRFTPPALLARVILRNQILRRDSMKLKVGDPAPPFTGTTTDGSKVSLADYAGRKLVLYFYPKDDTPGCTRQACSLRDL